jgi:alpha-L-arabinofuranosidase
MHPIERRRFLSTLGRTGALLAAGSVLDVIGYAQVARGPARAAIRTSPGRADFDRRVLGSFLEHLGRAVYTGVYDPGSPLADARGFRTDVLREVSEMGVPVVRYPGGNFVSGYNWLDGVGPKAERPTVLDRAWNSLETNQFGTNDFIDWCRAAGTEPLLGMNFGTGTAEMAVAYVEYCNLDRGTTWSDLRRAHGYEQPHGVRYWCLGNEMDGTGGSASCRRATSPRRCATTCRRFRSRASGCGCRSTSGTSGTVPAAGRRSTAASRSRPGCSRRSTTWRTRCWSAASSPPCCGIRSGSASAAWRSSPTSSRLS